MQSLLTTLVFFSNTNVDAKGVWFRQVSFSIFEVTSLFLMNMLSSQDIAEILLWLALNTN